MNTTAHQVLMKQIERYLDEAEVEYGEGLTYTLVKVTLMDFALYTQIAEETFTL